MGSGIINIRLIDHTLPPNYLEFGLSNSANVFPLSAQSSPDFIGLDNGIYHVFFRKVGSNWNVNNAIVKEINCDNAGVSLTGLLTLSSLNINTRRVSSSADLSAIIATGNYIGFVIVNSDSQNENRPTLYLVYQTASFWIPTQTN